MQAEHKRFLIVAVILVITAGLIFWIESTQKKFLVVEESLDFPLVLGNWAGEEIPVSERTMEILESPLVVIRKFTNPQGEVVYFSGIFSSRSRKAIHPPEVCLTGGGVSGEKDLIKLEIGNKNFLTNRLVILPNKQNEPEEVIYYWYKAGNKLFTNFYVQQLQMSWDLLRRKTLKSTDIALLRISTWQRKGEEEKDLEERLKDFAEVLFTYLNL